MRVCILHNIVSPYRLPLFEELNRTHEVTVLFCARTTPDRKWSIDLKGCHFRWKVMASRNLGPFVINPGIIFRLLTVNPDVYIIADNDENILSIFAVIVVAFLKRTQIIIWSEHIEMSSQYLNTLKNIKGTMAVKHYFSFFDFWRRHMLYPAAKVLLSMSGPSSTKFLLKRGVPEGKLIANTQIMPKELLLNCLVTKDTAQLTFLYLGYLKPAKQIDTIIKAFQPVSSRAKLIVAGTGPLERMLRKDAKSTPNVSFIGYIEGERKAVVLSKASILVLPSLYEPWGMVVNESLYYGTPVICSDAVAASELIQNGLNGIVFNVNDSQALGVLFKKLIDDPVLISKLTDGARNTDIKSLTSVAFGIKHIKRALDLIDER